MASPATKKRRTFFKSNLAFLPTISSSSPKPAIISRDKILAPLLDADLRRDSTPASDKALRARKPRISDESTATTASADQPGADENFDGEEELQKALFVQRKPRVVVKKYGRPRKTAPKTVRRIAVSTRPVRNKLRVIPSAPTSAPLRKVRISTPVTPPKRARGNASTAQSSNERLALAMQQAMRATVGGRTAPYERVPVWSEPGEGDEKPGSRAQVKRGRPAKGTTRRSVRGRVVRAGRKRKQPETETEEEESDESSEEEIKSPAKRRDIKSKEYMTSGFYCQDPNPESPFKLVNRVLNQASSKASGSGRRGKGKPQKLSIERITFPPMPYYEGQKKFLEEENEFVLPFHIHAEVISGILDGKKKPTPYQKLRGNIYPERQRNSAGFRAVCKCDPESACGDNCINRITNYLCGKDCPAGDACQNRSLARRPQPLTQVLYTGSRGFGLKAMEDIKADSFVTDYRGEVISIESFKDRIEDEYAGLKNFYALSYNRDEVIDAGLRGNDARFINHGCDPNLEVRKCQNLGDGLDEFEIGMWAARDIAKGEELFYNYNFDDFGAREDPRTPCHCGAATCLGFLGRRSGDKPAREIQQEARAEAKRAAGVGRKGKGNRVVKVTKTKVTVKTGPKPKPGRPRLAKPGRAVAQKAVVRARSKVVKKERERVAKAVKGGGEKKAPVSRSTSHGNDAGPSETRKMGDPTSSQTDTPIVTTVRVFDAPNGASVASATAHPSGARRRLAALDREHLAMDDMAIVDATLATTASSSSAPMPITPDGVMSDDDSASARRQSGWARWLLKIAGEKTRSLEEWHEERIKRRRGVAWMNMMIEELGVLPQPEGVIPNPDRYADGSIPAGSKGSFANTLAARGLGPEVVRNLGGPAHTYKGVNWQNEFGEPSSASPSAGPSPLPSPKKKRGRPSNAERAARLAQLSASTSMPDGLAALAGPLPTNQLLDFDPEYADADPPASEMKAKPPRVTEKKQQIKSRNGAPMGWSYVLEGEDVAEAGPSRLVSAVETGLDRAARRAKARASMP